VIATIDPRELSLYWSWHIAGLTVINLCGGGRSASTARTHADVIFVVCLMACKDFRRVVLLDEKHVVLIERHFVTKLLEILMRRKA
jgi:hypothetical protein